MIGTSIIKELSLLKAITSYYTILPSNLIGPISKRGPILTKVCWPSF